MAIYDNKIWLLKYIRDAFIATDDTGLCEIVMAGEDFSKIFRAPQTTCESDSSRAKSDDEDDRVVVSQFDPYPDMEDSEDDDLMCGSYIRYEEGGHRQRSNTAQWLDKKEQALKKAAKIKVVKWEDPPPPVSTEELAEIFSKVEVKKPEKMKSLLTEQLEKCPELPHRQYLEYAKFDGTAQLGLPTKTFKIFMTILPEKQQTDPLFVCVIASAKIKDLIGFTCYKYSIDHPEATLGAVQDYGLCIAEDDGEVDTAFPCLEAIEPCSKFGFTCLGLVELKKKHDLIQQSIPISEDSTFSGAFQGFPKAADLSHSHQNPSRHNTGGSGTSETVMSALRAVNEERRRAGDSDLYKIQSHIMASEAPQYKTYRVQMLRKVAPSLSVQLGVSLDRIEVEPLVSHKHAFWVSYLAETRVLFSAEERLLLDINLPQGFPRRPVLRCPHRAASRDLHQVIGPLSGRPAHATYAKHIYWRLMSVVKPKYFRHTVDSVAWCQVMEAKNNKTTFRILYSPRHTVVGFGNPGNSSFFHRNMTYKFHDFECDHEVAKEIVDKINTILDLRNSPCRREYKTAQEKKTRTRRSFHTKALS